MAWLLAPLYDRIMAGQERASFSRFRAEILAELSGAVVEIGAGTGANLRHYPDAVTELHVCEPDPGMRAQLEQKLAERPDLAARTTVHAAPGEALPFQDGRFDAAVSTLVLCTVGDMTASLQELRRVLKPAGRFAFLEHVCAPRGTWQRRWQQVAEPVWTPVAGGCRLTRYQDEAIAEAGFVIDRLDRKPIRGGVGLVRDTVRGVASKPQD
jgi:ubiquinone/menaquinone biosynthesis C-methylase UbiE